MRTARAMETARRNGNGNSSQSNAEIPAEVTSPEE